MSQPSLLSPLVHDEHRKVVYCRTCDDDIVVYRQMKASDALALAAQHQCGWREQAGLPKLKELR